ncbi:hypothetical protein PR001_g4513 [Phytophthora rubi]|uniref:Uncharacterized protein n=1 Tax=Phytophthora rubi TaxID=129364 RepID=A0A6A3NYH8_9STRA|nr:hypothetical protein PR001_g4513 [Phytophthora rubi]
MARAPHGSAAKKECEKCHDMISRSNFSKHAKKCSGIKVRESRSDIRKKSWEKNRLKRVGSQRNKRATKFFQELQDLRSQLHELEDTPVLPKPKPKGITPNKKVAEYDWKRDHPFELLSRHPDVFESVLSKVDKWEMLSKIWFKMLFLQLHPDRSHQLPADWQQEPKKSAILESFKVIRVYMERMLEEDPITVSKERIRIEKYRMYLRTTYKDKVCKWERQCQASRDEKLPAIKTMLDKFAEYKECKTLEEFKEAYNARFAEKDKAYETKAKAKEDQHVKDRQFHEVFGLDSDSE